MAIIRRFLMVYYWGNDSFEQKNQFFLHFACTIKIFALYLHSQNR